MKTKGHTAEIGNYLTLYCEASPIRPPEIVLVQKYNVYGDVNLSLEEAERLAEELSTGLKMLKEYYERKNDGQY